MFPPLSRRSILKVAAAAGSLAALPALVSGVADAGEGDPDLCKTTGARALVAALQAEGVGCVYGIPGAQENEFWDEMKAARLPYLLCTHEFSAACMADGYARSTGRPGVLAIVPGPGATNALTGLGEALLDSVPVVALVGDVARGEKFRPFQVHDLPNAALLQPVCKVVLVVERIEQIPGIVHQAFQLAQEGEPGPVAVVIPYPFLMQAHRFTHSGPIAPGLPFDEVAFCRAQALLSDRRLRVGIFAGLGCMNFSAQLTRLAEVMQAPVATTVSGKGAINECHPLAVGWGYGHQGTLSAEKAFRQVDCVLAIGARYSEVSTAFYAIPTHAHHIQVDANCKNIGAVVQPTLGVHADAGLFISRLLQRPDLIARPANPALVESIRGWKGDELRERRKNYARAGVDPMNLVLSLRAATCADALIFVDVTLSEHFAAEAMTTTQPRTYFNPTDNQAMGWSIGASLGAQKVFPGRQVVTITGDGCFLMSGLELATAAREGLPVKFFILDDGAYHFMQALQEAVYHRTTATVLPRLDYGALARGLGVGYAEIRTPGELDAGIRGALACPGPVLVRVAIDYGNRPVRWLEATRKRFIDELSTGQKVRFAGRIATRSINPFLKDD
jgi:acetolactate synthase-1/2/3 large subunit